jgi:hypothetical protein
MSKQKVKIQPDGSGDQSEDLEKRPDMIALDAFTRKILRVPKSELERLLALQKAKRLADP